LGLFVNSESSYLLLLVAFLRVAFLFGAAFLLVVAFLRGAAFLRVVAFLLGAAFLAGLAFFKPRARALALTDETVLLSIFASSVAVLAL